MQRNNTTHIEFSRGQDRYFRVYLFGSSVSRSSPVRGRGTSAPIPANLCEKTGRFGSRYDPHQRQLCIHNSRSGTAGVRSSSCARSSTSDVIYPRRAPERSAPQAKSHPFYGAMRLPRACGRSITRRWERHPNVKNSGVRWQRLCCQMACWTWTCVPGRFCLALRLETKLGISVFASSLKIAFCFVFLVFH